MQAQVFAHCRDAIAIMDADWRILAVNDAFEQITGFSAQAVHGTPGLSCLSDSHEVDGGPEARQHLLSHCHWKGEFRATARDGRLFPASAAITAIVDAQRQVSHYMAIFTDITERKLHEDRTRYQAEHDFLTGLPNTVLFADRLQLALASAQRHRTQLAILFLDLDRFKDINDTHGHATGDAVLKAVAGALTRCVRGADTVSRRGGDEFVLILVDIGGPDQAAHVAASVIDAIHAIRLPELPEVRVGCSVGIALWPGDGGGADELVHNADLAMYHAKQDGRGEFRFFSPTMNAHVVERIELENALRQALANEEFVLEYQPEVQVSSGLTIGVEALIRWRHPRLGTMLPEQFIPVAESNGLILQIGEWVLRKACEQARAWRDLGFPVVVAVNLSSAQFLNADLVGYVDTALQRAGLEARFLELEVTEAMIMQGDHGAVDAFAALQARGVQVTLDDFGTGAASLARLRNFPISKIKIDRSFVDDTELVPAIIALARSLKLRVAAEGVETAEQLAFLQQQGCDEYQGHLASLATAAPQLARARQ
nr:GGDEF and EAL domain-containing protein [Massilia sp. TS11]